MTFDESVAASLAQLEDLIDLHPGWRGYSGEAVSGECADKAMEVITMLAHVASYRSPSISPGDGGSVKVEWRRDGFDIEIGITQDRGSGADG